MGRPTRDEVADFLRRFKRAANDPLKKLVIWRRLKNADGPIQLGINGRQRNEILLGLTPANYCDGPKEDDNPEREGLVWFFGTEVNGQEVYIKLKIIEDDPFDQAECLSFHPAEHSLEFPFSE